MGYTAFVGTNNNPGDAEDLMPEEFRFGREELVDDKGARGEDVNDGALSDANVWPPKSEAPNFRDALVKY